MKILAIDLGKFKSVACRYFTETGKAEFLTVLTHVIEFEQLLRKERPDLVVIETCSIAGWVHDLCCHHGVQCDVAQPSNVAGSNGTTQSASRPGIGGQAGQSSGDAGEHKDPQGRTAGQIGDRLQIA